MLLGRLTGAGTVLLNLLTADRAIVCVAPEGENARGGERPAGASCRSSCPPPSVPPACPVTARGQSVGCQIDNAKLELFRNAVFSRVH
jgi:hypothetical protein